MSVSAMSRITNEPNARETDGCGELRKGIGMAHIAEYIGRKRRCWRVQLYVLGRRSSRTFRTEALARAWADREEARIEGMPQLRAKLEEHQILPLLPFKFREAVQKANFTEGEILACAFPVDLNSGIYFLIREGVIRYIGQTTKVLQRIAKHRREGKRFDSFSFIPCLPEHLAELEKTYICLLMPDENQKMC